MSIDPIERTHLTLSAGAVGASLAFATPLFGLSLFEEGAAHVRSQVCHQIVGRRSRLRRNPHRSPGGDVPRGDLASVVELDCDPGAVSVDASGQIGQAREEVVAGDAHLVGDAGAVGPRHPRRDADHADVA